MGFHQSGPGRRRAIQGGQILLHHRILEENRQEDRAAGVSDYGNFARLAIIEYLSAMLECIGVY